MKNQEVVAVPLKRNRDRYEIKAEDFYKVGIALNILNVNADEKGYRIQVKALSRVEVTDIHVTDNLITAKTVLLPDSIDLNENSQREMAAYIQNISHQVGAKFREADGIVKAIDEIKDLNVLMGYICRFIPLSKEEKYTLMETTSLKERSLTFIDYFLHYKETIQLQIEMTERFSERANKDYREAVLRNN